MTLCSFIGAAWILAAFGDASSPNTSTAKPWISLPGEPRAESLSLAKGAEFLDVVTVAWIEKKKCASCHTGFPYLMARRSMGDPKAPALLHVRKFLEDRVAAWDRDGKGTGYLQGAGPVSKTEGITEIVAIAATLAIDDAQVNRQTAPQNPSGSRTHVGDAAARRCLDME